MSPKKSISRIISIVILVVLLLMSALPVHPVFAAVTFTVDSTLDQPDDLTIPGTCHTAANTCTLRAAIMQANRTSGIGATIIVPAGIYNLTIPAAGADGEENGDLNLTSPVSGSPIITIIGDGPGTTIIDANQLDRVFYVHPNRGASISGIAIQNGYRAAGVGGGILIINGILTVTNSTISGNSALYGGGINNSGMLMVTNSTISGNSAGYGGGIDNSGGDTLTVTNSTISGNSADLGGGIFNFASALTVANSTISQNTAYNDGGGIYNWGTANVYNTSIVFNSADADVDFTGVGGGVFNDYPSGAIFNLRNSLVAGNKTRGLSRDCSGTLNSYGRNLFKSVIDCTVVTGSGSWTYIDSLETIGPLQNNGGQTLTHALLPGSNAIDGADPALGCLGSNSIPLATDQRGITRPQGSHCDIGAFEYRDPIFADVPLSYWASIYIESLYSSGITGGCSSSPLNYCPTNAVTRAQMAIFLLRGMHGSAYSPPPATGTKFNDVPLGTFGAGWIEQLATEGITSGCGGGNYCPTQTVSRAQMAIFLIRAKHGIAFVPPTATGIFPDVSAASFGANYIEQLVADGITSGCGGGLYCPNMIVKRDSMAVFLVKTFNLP